MESFFLSNFCYKINITARHTTSIAQFMPGRLHAKKSLQTVRAAQRPWVVICPKERNGWTFEFSAKEKKTRSSGNPVPFSHHCFIIVHPQLRKENVSRVVTKQTHHISRLSRKIVKERETLICDCEAASVCCPLRRC